MVFGNMGNIKGQVQLSVNPSTGENKLFGEFLINAQEDAVAGIRTPESIEKLKEIMPEIYDELLNISKILEKHYKDMQDQNLLLKKVHYIYYKQEMEKESPMLQLKQC